MSDNQSNKLLKIILIIAGGFIALLILINVVAGVLLYSEMKAKQEKINAMHNTSPAK